MSQEEYEIICYLCDGKQIGSVQTEWDIKRIMPKYFADVKPHQYTQVCQSCLDYIVKFDISSTHWERNENLIRRMRKMGNFRGLKDLINLKKTSSQICRLCFKETDTENAIYIYHENEVYQRGYVRKILSLHSPDTDLSLTENPIICNVCLDVIQTFDAFNEMCLHVKTAKSWKQEKQESEKESDVKKSKDCFNKDVVYVQLTKTSNSTVSIRTITEAEKAVCSITDPKEPDSKFATVNGWTTPNVVDLLNNKCLDKNTTSAAKKWFDTLVVISDDEDQDMVAKQGEITISNLLSTSSELNTSTSEKKEQEQQVDRRKKCKIPKLPNKSLNLKKKDHKEQIWKKYIEKPSKSKKKNSNILNSKVNIPKSKSKMSAKGTTETVLMLLPLPLSENCNVSPNNEDVNDMDNPIVEVNDNVYTEDTSLQNFSNNTLNVTESVTNYTHTEMIYPLDREANLENLVQNGEKRLLSLEFQEAQNYKFDKKIDFSENAAVYPILEINMSEVKKLCESNNLNSFRRNQFEDVSSNQIKIVEINIEDNLDPAHDHTQTNLKCEQNTNEITKTSDNKSNVEVLYIAHDEVILKEKTENLDELKLDMSELLDFNRAFSVSDKAIVPDELLDFTDENPVNSAIVNVDNRIPSSIKSFSLVYENFIQNRKVVDKCSIEIPTQLTTEGGSSDEDISLADLISKYKKNTQNIPVKRKSSLDDVSIGNKSSTNGNFNCKEGVENISNVTVNRNSCFDNLSIENKSSAVRTPNCSKGPKKFSSAPVKRKSGLDDVFSINETSNCKEGVRKISNLAVNRNSCLDESSVEVISSADETTPSCNKGPVKISNVAVKRKSGHNNISIGNTPSINGTINCNEGICRATARRNSSCGNSFLENSSSAIGTPNCNKSRLKFSNVPVKQKSGLDDVSVGNKSSLNEVFNCEKGTEKTSNMHYQAQEIQDEIITIDDDNVPSNSDEYCVYYPFKKSIRIGTRQKKKDFYGIVMEKRNGSRLYKCSKCNGVVKLAQQLQKHFCSFQKSFKGPMNFVCTACDYFTFGKDNLRRHEIWHKVLNTCTIKCDLCQYYSSEPDLIQRHKKSQHQRGEKKGDNKCPFCPFSADNMRIVTFHMTSRHKANWGQEGKLKGF